MLVKSGCVDTVLAGLTARLFNSWNSAETTEAREALFYTARGLDSLMTMIKNIAEENPND